MKKLIVLFFITLYANAQTPAKLPLSLMFQSPYDLNETVTNIQNSIKAANYRVYEPRYLLQGLATKGVSTKAVVLRFCNFAKMYEFMQVEKRLGVVLPCRMTVIENKQNEVFVIVENYKRTVDKFNNPQVSREAENIIEELTEIIEDALL